MNLIPMSQATQQIASSSRLASEESLKAIFETRTIGATIDGNGESRIRSEILQAVEKAIVICGQGKNMTPGEKEILADFLIEDLNDPRKRQKMKVGYLEAAIIAGAKGEFGDIHGINLNTVLKWLNAYLDKKIHEDFEAANKKDEAKPKEFKKFPPTPRQARLIELWNLESLLIDYEKSFNAGAIPETVDYGNTIFPFLQRIEFIQVDKKDFADKVALCVDDAKKYNDYRTSVKGWAEAFDQASAQDAATRKVSQGYLIAFFKQLLTQGVTVSQLEERVIKATRIGGNWRQTMSSLELDEKRDKSKREEAAHV